MKSINKIGILFGAPDIEQARAIYHAMRFLERGQISCVAQAVIQSTRTSEVHVVQASQAYAATGISVLAGCESDEVTEWLTFECDVACLYTKKIDDGTGEVSFIPSNKEFEAEMKFDHHRPGDAGFHSPAEEYFTGSSLGQMLFYFDPKMEEVEEVDFNIAAGDHHPAAAYQGLCPGICPKQFEDLRLGIKAKFSESQGHVNIDTTDKLRDLISEAENHIGNSPLVNGIHDLTSAGIVPMLEEASLRSGKPIVFLRKQRITNQVKIFLSGVIDHRKVEFFMAEAEIAYGNLVDEVYGAHQRGYARIVFKAGVTEERILKAKKRHEKSLQKFVHAK
jgi:hypothetical protein